MSSSMYGSSAEYAMHSMLILMTQTAPISVRDMAVFQELPERYLAKLFTKLQKAGLVISAEGTTGGFTLGLPPEQISVLDILKAVDSHRTLFECAEIRKHCALFKKDAPPKWSVTGMCRIHHFMQEAENTLMNFLKNKTLADLGAEFEQKAPAAFIKDSREWFWVRRIERTNKKGVLND